MKPIGTKPIKTARLVLRPIEAKDAATLVEIRSLAMSLEEAKKAVRSMMDEARKPFGFHWVLTKDGQVIGRIKGWEVDPYNGYIQLGYDVGKEFRNQGYMTEAVSAVIHYMMNDADAHRVYCSIRAGNIASCRVCEKCGMRLEGTLREHYARQDGGFDDVHIYGIVKADCTEGRK